MKIHGVEVFGVEVDGQTRCAHYHSLIDIVAIKFKCCGEYFPCYECHTECAGHEPKVWSQSEFNTLAILCGACGYKLTINEYFGCDSVCPACSSKFNPGCAKHYHLYFEDKN